MGVLTQRLMPLLRLGVVIRRSRLMGVLVRRLLRQLPFWVLLQGLPVLGVLKQRLLLLTQQPLRLIQ